jgi:ferritin
MKKPNKLSDEVVELLTECLGEEYKAFYFYKDAANCLRTKGFYIAADFFDKESVSETDHANKLQKFLTDWNVKPELPVIESPSEEEDEEDEEGLIETIGEAYDLEYALYEKYEEVSVKVLSMGDVCVFNFLKEFCDIQTQSVAEYSDMLALLEGVKGSKFELLMLEESLFNE